MKIRLVRTPRLPRWPRWAVVVALVWAIFAWAAVVLSRHVDALQPLCPFKRLTGLPCPTCGMTRGALCLLHGDVLAAVAFNPLVFVAGALASAWLMVRVLFGRSIRLHFAAAERGIAWVLAGLALAANWAYVIVYVH